MSDTPGVYDLAPGLWIWRTWHEDWVPMAHDERVVTSTFVESRGERIVIDPLAPPKDDPAWERLEASPPTMAVVLKPDHVRSVDLFVERFGCRAYGPDVFFVDDLPGTEIEPYYAVSELPGGLLGLYDGRSRNETPVLLPDHGTIVFADALTTIGGELQVWDVPWREYAFTALRAMLDLDFERVIISHGSPVHSRADFAAALDRPPFHIEE